MSRFHSFFVKSLLGAVVMTSAFAAAAHGTVITFDDVAGFDVIASYTKDGFTLTTSGSASFNVFYIADQSDVFPSGPGIYPYHGGSTITLTGPGLFKISSIDFRGLNSGISSQTIPFTGFKADGSTVSQQITTHAGISLHTFPLSDDFTNLTSLQFTTVDTVMDNLVVFPVPEPAGMALLLGLSGLTIRRRRYAPGA